MGSFSIAEFWVPRLKLSFDDRDLLLESCWLNDNIVHSAQQLLKKEAPVDVGGFQSPQYGTNLKFKPLCGKKFIQILNINGNHWITVSNIHQEVAERNTIYMYDSMLPSRINIGTKRQICSLMKPPAKTLSIFLVDVMAQPNLYDCGVFAIANATELAHGKDPAKAQWDANKMRSHLLSCLQEGRMNRFPISIVRRVPFGRRVKTAFDESVYCTCRMPYDKNSDPAMIQCNTCHGWFHGQCMNIDIEEYVQQKWTCKERLSL